MDVKLTVDYAFMHDSYRITTTIPTVYYSVMKEDTFTGFSKDDNPITVAYENKALSGFTFDYLVPTEKTYHQDYEGIAAGYCDAINNALKAKNWPYSAASSIVTQCYSQFMGIMKNNEAKYINAAATLDYYKSDKVMSGFKNLGFINNLEYKFAEENFESEITKYIKSYNTYEVSLGPFSIATEDDSQFSAKAKELPGMNAKVKPPCPTSLGHYCSIKLSLREAIMHLNDHHKFSREKIADWLDELHDSGVVNLEFDVETISDEEISAVAGGGEQ